MLGHFQPDKSHFPKVEAGNYFPSPPLPPSTTRAKTCDLNSTSQIHLHESFLFLFLFFQLCGKFQGEIHVEKILKGVVGYNFLISLNPHIKKKDKVTR